MSKQSPIQEFSMVMTQGASMRWKMTASDTKKDSYDERMTLPLYRSFITNINDKKDVPEAFKSLVTSDFWKGGMPYVSVSHYPDLNGAGVPGIPESIYIDGETFKAKGKFFDTKLGRSCYKSLSNDSETPLENKIRVSIAFLDLAHQHGNTPVFERKSLEDVCPQCEEGIGDKKYLDGYLVHLAMTRVPVNKRSNMEVEKSMTTRKQDAESIIDPELAKELEEKALLVGKSDAVVEFSEASTSKNVEEKADGGGAPEVKSEVLPPPVVAVVTPNEDGIPAVIHPQVWATAKGQEAITVMFAELNANMEKIFMRSDLSEDMRKTSIVTLVNSLQQYVGVKPSMLAEPILSLVDAVIEAKSMLGTDEEKLTSVQPSLNALGDEIRNLVAPPKPVDPKDEAIASLSSTLAQLQNDMAVMKAQIAERPATATTVTTAAPKPRSASPALVRSLVQQAQVTQPKKLSSVEQLVFARAGLSK